MNATLDTRGPFDPEGFDADLVGGSALIRYPQIRRAEAAGPAENSLTGFDFAFEKLLKVDFVVVVCSAMLVGHLTLLGKLVESRVLQRTNLLYKAIVKQIRHTLINVVSRSIYLHRNICSQIPTLSEFAEDQKVSLREFHIRLWLGGHRYDTIGNPGLNNYALDNEAIEPAVILSTSSSLCRGEAGPRGVKTPGVPQHTGLGFRIPNTGLSKAMRKNESGAIETGPIDRRTAIHRAGSGDTATDPPAEREGQL